MQLRQRIECLIPHTDSRWYIRQYVCDLWRLWHRDWDLAVHNERHAIKIAIGGQPFTYSSHKEQVILVCLRLGHTCNFIHFLMKEKPPPVCSTCECQLSIQPILVCMDYDFIRPELFGNILH